MHVAVLGAGAAGLAATRELTHAGVAVTLIEARDRLGGRVWTIPSPRGGLPTELGAEFIHGEPAEIDSLVSGASLRVQPVVATRLLSLRGAVHCSERVDEQLTDGAVHGEQERVFMDGYATLTDALVRGVDFDRAQLCLRHVVDEVSWHHGGVTIRANHEGAVRTLRANAAIVTLPVGVLQTDAVRFSPSLDSKRAAIERLEMGHVLRMTMHFSAPIWNAAPDDQLHRRWSFLFTDDADVPTFWRRGDGDVLVGWAAAQYCDHVPPTDVARRRLLVQSVARQLHLPRSVVDATLLRIDCHDWQADPYARGAYTCYRAGDEQASRTLAETLDETLYFAGEATALSAHDGTVDGAIASGQRAARQILDARQHAVA